MPRTLVQRRLALPPAPPLADRPDDRRHHARRRRDGRDRPGEQRGQPRLRSQHRRRSPARATHQIVGGPAGLDESVYARAAHCPACPCPARPSLPTTSPRPSWATGRSNCSASTRSPRRRSARIWSPSRAGSVSNPGRRGPARGLPDPPGRAPDFRGAGGRVRADDWATRSTLDAAGRAVDRLRGRPAAARTIALRSARSMA